MAALKPKSEAELAALVAEAHRAGRKLELRGAGTKTAGETGGEIVAHAAPRIADQGQSHEVRGAATVASWMPFSARVLDASRAPAGLELPEHPGSCRPESLLAQ